MVQSSVTKPFAVNRRYVACFMGIMAYVLLLLWLQSYHEMWRDEWQAWLLSSDTMSLTELWQNTRHETHPPLWYLLLWSTQHLFSHSSAMQYGNIILAACAVFIWVRYAPGSLLQRLLFPFGYFILYEYGVISRNYALCVALMFTFCLMYRRSRWLISAVLLALVAVTHPLGLLFSISWWIAELFVANPQLCCRRKWLILAAIGILIAGVQIHSRASYPLHFGTYTSLSTGRLVQVTANMLDAFAPLPFSQTAFRYDLTMIPRMLPSPNTQALFATLLLLFFALAFSRNRRALIAWVIFIVGFGVFQYVLFNGRCCLRYAGLLYCTALCGWWLSHDAIRPRPPAVRWLFTSLFVLQAVAGVQTARLDIEFPFSQAKAVATFLTAKGLANGPVLVEPDYAAIPIAGYLGQPVRHLDSNRLTTYLIEDYPQHSISEPQLRQRLRRLPATDFPAILIRTEPLSQYFPATPLAIFEPAAVDDEQYYLYLIEQDPTGIFQPTLHQ